MKQTFTSLFILLLCSSQIFGKTTGISIPSLYPHFGSGAPIPNPNGTNPTRIIAQTYLEYNGSSWVPIDSATYIYSNGRSGSLSDEYDDNYVNFDESYTYVYNAATGIYKNRMHRTQVFNTANKVATYTVQGWKNNNTWADSAQYEYQYHANLDQLLVTNFQLWYGFWQTHVFYKNTFDEVNRVIKIESNIYKTELVYDAANNVVQRADSQWHPLVGWSYTNRFSFYYDAFNNITSYIIEQWNGSNWENNEKIEYTYNGNDIISAQEYEWNNIWEIKAQHNFTYDVNHNKITDEYQIWDIATSSFININKASWTYNANAQPLSYQTQTWDAVNNIWVATTDDFYYRFYYEPYIPTSIKNIAHNNLKVLLYPQPATTTLNISISEEKLQSYTAYIYDMQGKLQKQFSYNYTEQQTISVADLPSGNYILKITGKEIQGAQQFIVAH